jgi:hypothetical protein
MIPKELILDVTRNEKRIILYSYFASKRGLDNTIGFSCNSVVEWCGYKKNYNKDKSNDLFIAMINQFISEGYILIDKDKINICRDYCNIAELDEDKFTYDSQFAIVYLNELERILGFKKYTKDVNRMSPAILILVLSYLRVNMLRRQENYIGKESDKPEFCYRMYIDIEKDIGLSNRYISRAVNILNDLDIIVSQEMVRYKDENDNWHTDVTLFVNRYKYDKQGHKDKKYNFVDELKWGIEYIKEKKYLKKKFSQDTEQ